MIAIHSLEPFYSRFISVLNMFECALENLACVDADWIRKSAYPQNKCTPEKLCSTLLKKVHSKQREKKRKLSLSFLLYRNAFKQTALPPLLAAILIGGLNKVAFAPSTVFSKVAICGIGKNRVETHLPPIQKEINIRKRSTAGIQNCIPPDWSY
jgi:hypothetical protein